MKTIPLTQGKFAIVDDEDYEWLMQWKWYAHKNGNNNYMAARRKKYKAILMHRTIMDAPSDKQVDHFDHNKLNNQRTNLRLCTNSQNCQNRISQRGSSQYKGVRWNKNRWMARIGINGKLIYLGLFINEVKAAKAYDKAAKESFGEFAYLNFGR